MKQFFIIWTFVLGSSILGYAQKINTDIFNNLSYESKDGNYKAHLKQNVFDDLVFSDSRNNKITLKGKYIEKYYATVPEDLDLRIDLFRNMIRGHRMDENYEASFSVDIFGNTTIKDSKGNKMEVKKDIFGNEVYKERFEGNEITIEKGLDGELAFEQNEQKASLEKDIFDKYVYSDSQDNKLQISEKTWRRLQQKYGNDENIFMYLIKMFLF